MKYAYYIDICIPEEDRSSDVMLVLELLRYMQSIQVEEKYIRVPCPHGIGRPLVWQEQNIAHIASFGIKAEARRATRL